MTDVNKLISNYDECPDMKVWIQEQLLSGVEIKLTNRNKTLLVELWGRSIGKDRQRAERLKLWKMDRVWKVQQGQAYRTSMPSAYVQRKTLAEAFEYFKKWYDNPCPVR